MPTIFAVSYFCALTVLVVVSLCDKLKEHEATQFFVCFVLGLATLTALMVLS